jgi:5-methylcytosine-specific restriction protein A
MRAQVLAEEPFCRVCLAEGKRVQASEVDHIVPLAAGGDNSRGNQQGLCKPCHEVKSQRERSEARHGPGGGSISGGD